MAVSIRKSISGLVLEMYLLFPGQLNDKNMFNYFQPLKWCTVKLIMMCISQLIRENCGTKLIGHTSAYEVRLGKFITSYDCHKSTVNTVCKTKLGNL